MLLIPKEFPILVSNIWYRTNCINKTLLLCYKRKVSVCHATSVHEDRMLIIQVKVVCMLHSIDKC